MDIATAFDWHIRRSRACGARPARPWALREPDVLRPAHDLVEIERIINLPQLIMGSALRSPPSRSSATVSHHRSSRIRARFQGKNARPPGGQNPARRHRRRTRRRRRDRRWPPPSIEIGDVSLGAEPHLPPRRSVASWPPSAGGDDGTTRFPGDVAAQHEYLSLVGGRRVQEPMKHCVAEP